MAGEADAHGGHDLHQGRARTGSARVPDPLALHARTEASHERIRKGLMLGWLACDRYGRTLCARLCEGGTVREADIADWLELHCITPGINCSPNCTSSAGTKVGMVSPRFGSSGDVARKAADKSMGALIAPKSANDGQLATVAQRAAQSGARRNTQKMVDSVARRAPPSTVRAYAARA